MRAMLLSTVGLVALAASSGVGLAADLIVAEPDAMPAAGFDWAGAYAGVALGGGITHADYEDGGGNANLTQGSLLALGTVGFNWLNGNLLYGIEGDIGVVRGMGDVTTEYDSVWEDGTLNGVVGTLRGRVGFATENLLLYGTAGLAAVKDDYQLGSLWSGDALRFGLVAGAGVEVAVADNVSLKAEARYYAFGEGDAAADGYTYTSNAAVGLVGVNFHF